jgi:hypothetical protein
MPTKRLILYKQAMAHYFTTRSFQYFDQAQKNKNSLKWFEKNKALRLLIKMALLS